MNVNGGKLFCDVIEADLRDVFQDYGRVTRVTIPKDRTSGESRGFGFVVMLEIFEAQAAISGLNGKVPKGQRLKVNQARPRPDRREGGEPRGGSRRLTFLKGKRCLRQMSILLML